jgi:hypothetical protein
MCCFLGTVTEVADTKIFARLPRPGWQLLIYQMQFSANAAVAMVLPIPVTPGSGEDAVVFHSLEGHDKLFADLDDLFPEPAASRARGPNRTFSALTPAPLKVHAVGAFIASYVPSLGDLNRLDPRLRVPPGTLDRIAEYQSWGFAVFKLAAARRRARVPPMAFEFPTQEPHQLYFPTLHLHDGTLPELAPFSHQLFAQGLGENQSPERVIRYWEHSAEPPRRFAAKPGAKLFDLDQPVHRASLFGLHRNADIWVSAAS